MSKKRNNYSHLVEIDSKRKKLVLYRMHEDGSKILYTEIDLPNKIAAEDEDAFERFACELGENIILDSPMARQILGL